MKNITLQCAKTLLLLSVVLVSKSWAQSTYYNGGRLFDDGVNVVLNNVQQPVFAPAGYKWSRADYPNASNLGWGGFGSSGTVLSDRFTVPAGENWTINDVEFLAFALNTNSPLSVSGLYVQIWSSDPSLPNPTLVYNAQSNVLIPNSIQEYFMYRIGMNAPATSYKIWKMKGLINHQLQAGQYWISWYWNSATNIFFPDYQVTDGVAKRTFDGSPWSLCFDAVSNKSSRFPFAFNYNNVLANTQFEKNDLISIYPNPAKDKFTLITKNLSNDSTPKLLAIYDIKGLLLKYENINSLQDEHIINTASLANGLYIINILNDKNVVIYSNKLTIK